MKYTQLVNFRDDHYEVTTATTEDEIKALGKAGFVKYDEHNGITLLQEAKEVCQSCLSSWYLQKNQHRKVPPKALSAVGL